MTMTSINIFTITNQIPLNCPKININIKITNAKI